MSVAANVELDGLLSRMFEGDPELVHDPYPIYKRLLEESPVHRFGEKTAIISRHRDVKASYKDVERFPTTKVRGNPFDGHLRLLSDDDRKVLDYVQGFESSYISRKNGEDHARIRTAAQRYFTPARVAKLEPTFQRIFDELLDEKKAEGTFDFLAIAYKLPLLVITELLGVPRKDAEQVKHWGDGINPRQLSPLPPEIVHSQWKAINENSDYIRGLIAWHRQNPERTELVSSVLDAADSDRMTEQELIAFFVHTLFAGHETTQHMIGNGLYHLMRKRDQWDRLRENAGLAPAAVEEILRFDSPVPSISKLTGTEVEVSGVTLPPGLTVLLLQAAANRDPEVFDDPETFDIGRQPNDQLSLGFGPHFCLGASLARVEGRIVFETLSRRFPEIRIAGDSDALRFHGPLRGLYKLPVTLGPEHKN
jgi:cytochrome P450